MAAKARLSQLVAANAPVFYLHPADRFMPCTVEWFMHHSELRQQAAGSEQGSAGDRVLLTRGQVNAAALAAAEAQHGSAGGLQLDIDEAGHWGYPLDLIDDVPLYVNAKEVLDSSGRTQALELNYMTFYAHNGSYSVLGQKVGAHDGDWEHMTVRLDAGSGAVLGAYFHAHRNHDGVWVAAGDLPRCPGGSGRPAAYVALHGHGTYPAAGRHLRALFVANDLCSGQGPVWRPRRCVLLPPIPGMEPVPGAAPLAPGERRLMRVPSRGSCLRAPPQRSAARGDARRAANGAAAAGRRASRTAAAPARHSIEQSVVDIFSRHMAESVPATDAVGDATAAASAAGGVAAAPAAPTAAATDSAAVAAAGSADGQNTSHTDGNGSSGVQVIEGPTPWLTYRGRWGTTPSPITQKWFLCAEPPVSRTTFRRILHFLPEARLPGS